MGSEASRLELSPKGREAPARCGSSRASRHPRGEAGAAYHHPQPSQILPLGGVSPSWWRICWKPTREPGCVWRHLSPPCSGLSPMPAHPGQRSWSPRQPQPSARGLGGFSCTEPICECFAECLIQGVPSIKLVQTSGSHIQLHLHSVPFITAGNGKAP